MSTMEGMSGSSSSFSSSGEDISSSEDSSNDSETSNGTVSPVQPSRRRPAWQLVRCSSQDTGVTLKHFMASLPSRSTRKNDCYACTIYHTSLAEDDNPQERHTMRTVLTKCTSARCALVNAACGSRYKINTCELSDLVFVFQDGQHAMLDENEGSPRVAKLTAEMKAFVESEMSMNSGVTPHVVFTRLCTVLKGPPPLETQVQGYMKRWRAKNRDDSMQPVIDICARSMCELNRHLAQARDELLVFCDSTCENGNLAPNVGNASDELPFRMDLTCYSLLEDYATVQGDPRCTTILHVDSTHNLVRQRYSVFILGYSDCCGHFFPLVYYCASQRRAEDVAWCLSYLKRVMLQLFGTRFAPQYMMADADNGQYNACTSEMPTTKILMCWFHVCQNVWKKARKLPKHQQNRFFGDLNDLHFCRNDNEFDLRKAHIMKEWKTLGTTCSRFRAVAKKIRRQWFDNPRFSKWQAFHTPPGYATTNNPVEQYHRKVKLVNSTTRATPIEMVQLLDRSRIGFLAKNAKFSSTMQASKRLKAHYNKIKKRGDLSATVLLPVGDLRSQLVLVKQVIPEMSVSAAVPSTILRTSTNVGWATQNTVVSSRRTNAPKKKKKSEFDADDVNQPIKSSHTLRMQWEGMPEDGWVVDATSRACQCRFHSKYNICPHIIEATKQTGLPCPGFKSPVGRFESRDKRQRKSTARPSSATTYSHLQRTRFSSVPESVRCPGVPDFEAVLAPPVQAPAPHYVRTGRPSSAPSRTLHLDISAPDNSSAQYTTTRHLTLRESCEHTKRRRC